MTRVGSPIFSLAVIAGKTTATALRLGLISATLIGTSFNGITVWPVAISISAFFIALLIATGPILPILGLVAAVKCLVFLSAPSALLIWTLADG